MTHELLKHEFLTKAQVAALFQCHPNSIDQWIKKGGLPQGVSMGGHRMWPTESIKAHVQQRCLAYGYAEAEVADIFARANLAPPGDYIEMRVPLGGGLSEQTAKRISEKLTLLVRVALKPPPPVIEAEPIEPRVELPVLPRASFMDGQLKLR